VISQEKTQDTLQHSLEASEHRRIASVSCPAEQTVETGVTFTCAVRYADGREATATLKIRDKEADVSVIRLQGK
jgi:Domain of unknown function (DUF4333)